MVITKWRNTTQNQEALGMSMRGEFLPTVNIEMEASEATGVPYLYVLWHTLQPTTPRVHRTLRGAQESVGDRKYPVWWEERDIDYWVSMDDAYRIRRVLMYE